MIKDCEYDEIEEALQMYENEKHQRQFHSKVQSLKQLSKLQIIEKSRLDTSSKQLMNRSGSFLVSPTTMVLQPDDSARSASTHIKEILQVLPSAGSSTAERHRIQLN